MLDSCGRTIDYLRLSVTDLCNYRCRYCMPPEGVCKQSHGSILSIEELAEIAGAFWSCAGCYGSCRACGSFASPPTQASFPLWPAPCERPVWTG